MSLVEVIRDKAKDYLDRPALIGADGSILLYGDLVDKLILQTEYRTSGTTQLPKSVTIDDTNLQKRLKRLVKVRGERFSKVERLFAPFGSSPLGIQLRMHIWLNGGTYYWQGQEPDHKVWMDMCEKHSVQAIAFIPKLSSMWKCLGHPYRFDQVYVSGSAASDAQMETLRKELGNYLYINYAATEVGQISGAPYGTIKHIPGCVGLVADDVIVEIDKDQVRIRCDTMVDGYKNDKELTVDRFKDGWFYPGDLGHFDGNYLVIDGRV